MMKLRLILILVLFLGALHSSFAQKIMVSGTVKDENGVALIGATVAVKGTRIGVATDFHGVYTIGVDPGQTLIFSFIGTQTQEHKITKSNNALHIVLQYEAEALDDVVVVGYGSAKKIGTTIGSVAKVAGKDLAESPTPNVLDALQGKVAGLAINATSGEPGSAPIVLLHGLGTLSDVNASGKDGLGSTPLYVVDGLPVDDGLVASLNPDDFESVTVLKDASATSIYGARAAYGVIYVTTKKGGFEQPTEVSVSSQIGFSQISSYKFYDNLLTSSEYVDYMLDLGHLPNKDVADIFRQQYKGNTRWDKIYFKPNSLTAQNNVSVMGGGKKVSYYFSGSNFKQGGNRYGSDYERYSLRANIDSRIKDWLSAGLSLSVGHSISTSNGGNRGNYGGVMALPIYEAYDEEGRLVDYVTTIYGNRFYLPQYTASKLLSNGGNTNIVPNFYVTLKPIDNLIFKTQAGLQYSVSVGENKILPSYDQSGGIGQVSRTFGEHINKTLTNTLEYKFRIGDKSFFTALLGQESVSNDSKGFSASSSGQVADGLTTLLQGKKEPRVGDSRDVSTYNSFFSRVDYSYDGRYFIDFSGRRDGSSTFGRNNRYANFWSAGLMWNAKNEAFLKDVSWLDELRFKISTGTAGSKGGAGSYGSYSRLDFGQYREQASYHLSNLGNPDLRWEKQDKTTIGMNLGLFNRVKLEVDLYQRVIRDMYYTLPLPMISGFGRYPTNLAKLQNRGADVTLYLDVIKDTKNKLYVSPYVNFNYNDMRILGLFVGNQQIPEDEYSTGYEVGSQLMIFAPIFKRVNPDNGDPEWYVPGEDKMKTTTDDTQITTKFDRVTLNQNTGKTAYAPWNGGFGLNASYKGLSLQMGFAFSYGKYQANQDRYHTESSSAFAYNVSRESLNYWKQPGDNVSLPRKELQFVQYDSRLLEDASFIRLKNINVGYSLPKEVMETIPFFTHLRFFATGRNLLTFTNYTGADPEFGILLSQGGYPNTRQYTFGVEFKF
ncbi:SusC/RagA family TonB-linked outer membrane protein [Capnocytophaga stomatis]|uniref:SusC/RagA family TonB-linked outer membrane protein n=1 Tax=Capnocytophaga stomatis TaxID=1848904 RepID=UPI00194EA1E8|nr:SusC/RagA family TonB-linked outer membrane protein [Capnocytophaga stomatis]GIJ95045.1 SusC/RagA family TonB-linked outer membrane protein [Capnocytophaga stomatis]